MFGRNKGAAGVAAHALERISPYADQLATDDKLRRRLVGALGAALAAQDRARRQAGLAGIATRLGTDPVLRAQLTDALAQLRKAKGRIEKRRSHKVRNAAVVVALGDRGVRSAQAARRLRRDEPRRAADRRVAHRVEGCSAGGGRDLGARFRWPSAFLDRTIESSTVSCAAGAVARRWRARIAASRAAGTCALRTRERAARGRGARRRRPAGRRGGSRAPRALSRSGRPPSGGVPRALPTHAASSSAAQNLGDRGAEARGCRQSRHALARRLDGCRADPA